MWFFKRILSEELDYWGQPKPGHADTMVGGWFEWGEVYK